MAGVLCGVPMTTVSSTLKRRILRVTSTVAWMEAGIDLHTERWRELPFDVVIAVICGVLASWFLTEAQRDRNGERVL